jgi:uncharacterized protein (DUF4415 family)
MRLTWNEAKRSRTLAERGRPMTARKRASKAKWVDPDEAAELTGEELARADAVWRIGGKVVSAEQGRAAFKARLGKRQINMFLDRAVIEHFKEKAGGRGYQTLINEALREAIGREDLEKSLRRIVREELRRSKRATR